jgi:hypothetical protein
MRPGKVNKNPFSPLPRSRYNRAMSESSTPTGFVIKAVSATGLAMWVSPPRFGKHRVFGPRENAEVFRTQGEAHSAIGTLPRAFEHAGFNFAVESIG